MSYIFGDGTNNSIISTSSTPGLTPGAETVILYSWTSGEDRVVDIDVFFWQGSGSSDTSFLFSKTGVTVGSHTYLPDTETTEFMHGFHAALAQGETPAAALRATALAIRARKPHPFYWAPFVLLGCGS